MTDEQRIAALELQIAALSQQVTELTEKPLPESAPLYKAVTQMLKDIGVPAHIKGYSYVREAIIMAVRDEGCLDQITKMLYPEVAKKFKTTPSRAERAIRTAIEVAWDRGDIAMHDELFGSSVSVNKGKPTNSKFIAGCAEWIRNGGR